MSDIQIVEAVVSWLIGGPRLGMRQGVDTISLIREWMAKKLDRMMVDLVRGRARGCHRALGFKLCSTRFRCSQGSFQRFITRLLLALG